MRVLPEGTRAGPPRGIRGEGVAEDGPLHSAGMRSGGCSEHSAGRASQWLPASQGRREGGAVGMTRSHLLGMRRAP